MKRRGKGDPWWRDAKALGALDHRQRGHIERSRGSREDQPMLVLAVVTPTAMTRVLGGLAIMKVAHRAVVVSRGGQHACRWMSSLRAYGGHGRLDERAGHQAQQEQRDPAGTWQWTTLGLLDDTCRFRA